MADLNVVELKRPDYFNVAKALRNLADDIDRGEYEGVLTCAVALYLPSEINIFGSGPCSDLASVYFTLGRAKAAIDSGSFEEA